MVPYVASADTSTHNKIITNRYMNRESITRQPEKNTYIILQAGCYVQMVGYFPSCDLKETPIIPTVQFSLLSYSQLDFD